MVSAEHDNTAGVNSPTGSEAAARIRPAEVLSGCDNDDARTMAASLRRECLAGGGQSAESRFIALAEEAERLVIADLSRALKVAEALTLAGEGIVGAGALSRACRVRGQALAYSNRFEEALVALDRAASLARDASRPADAARARMTSIHPLARLGRFGEAVAAGAEAHAVFLEAGDPLAAAQADVNTAVTLRMKGDAAAALDRFDRALPALRSNPTFVARVESNRAEALLDLGRFADAETAFQSALDAFHAAAAKRAEGIVRGNLADLCGRQGRLDQALNHFELARRILGESDAPGDVARLEVEQAEVLALMGLGEEASALFRSALPRLQEHKMAAEAARAGLGLAVHLVDRFGAVAAKVPGSDVGTSRVRDELARVLDLADESFRSLVNVPGQARVLAIRSRLAIERGDTGQAAALAERAADMLHDRPGERSGCESLRSRTALHEGDTPGALAWAQRALDSAKAGDIAPLVADALRSRAEARMAGGDRVGALADLTEAITQIDRVRGTLQADRFRAAFSGERAGVYADAAVLAIETAERSDDGSGVRRAFDLLERGRARSLLDLLHGGVRLAETVHEGDAENAELLRDLGDARAALSVLYATMGTAPDWHDRARMLEDRVRVVERRLAATRRFASVFAEPVSASECMTILRPGERLAAYFEERGRLSAVVLDRGRVTVVRAFTAAHDVNEAVDAFYFQIGRAMARGLPAGAAAGRLVRDAERALGALCDLVWRPLEQRIGAATGVFVVPHGRLYAVPFGAMVGCPVAVAPSASVLHRIRSVAAGVDAARSGGGTLIVGYSDELAPRIEREVDQVASRVPGATVLAGERATVRAVRRAMNDATHIHIASHARFVSRDPMSSGLKLADGWLTAREIYQSRLAGATVVLSGCDTGRAAINACDETWGLVRSFLGAGASRLAMSLWPVHDVSAERLMTSLYGHGVPCGAAGGAEGGLAAALARASAAVRQEQPHPAAWGPFMLIGEL